MDDQSPDAGASRRDPVGIRRGALWWADLPSPWGRRPVLLIARDSAYTALRWITVAPLTTRVRTIPTAVLLDPERDPIPERCTISLDNIQVVERDWLVEPIGYLSQERLDAVDLALHFALGIERCPSP